LLEQGPSLRAAKCVLPKTRCAQKPERPSPVLHAAEVSLPFTPVSLPFTPASINPANPMCTQRAPVRG